VDKGQVEKSGQGLVGALSQRTGDIVVVLFASALMVASAFVHLHLWDIAYRHVATLGPLFLVQAVAALVAAVVLGATRLVVVMLGSVLLMLGTVGGFVLADTVGLFGFKLPELRRPHRRVGPPSPIRQRGLRS
jgi:hypothetical protein